MTRRPVEIDGSFVAALQEAGLDEPAMREAANVGFHYNLINRVADALDYPVPVGKQKERLAQVLNLAGKALKGAPAGQIWVRGTDGRIRPPEVELGREHMLTTDGWTKPALRRAVDEYARCQWMPGDGKSVSLPNELAPYVEKLSRHAYRITDDDVIALQDCGYSDEAIYEITLVGAIGTASVGLEQLFGILYGS